MNVIKTDNRFCLSCMQFHNVDTVSITMNYALGEGYIEYKEEWEYCTKNNELIAGEYLIKKNQNSLKEAIEKAKQDPSRIIIPERRIDIEKLQTFLHKKQDDLLSDFASCGLSLKKSKWYEMIPFFNHYFRKQGGF